MALSMMQSAHNSGRAFNIAILDYLMPNMDGMDLAVNIKQHTDLRGTALIMLTSGSQRSAASTFIAAGCSVFLTKPLVRPTQLFDALKIAWEGDAATFAVDIPAAAIRDQPVLMTAGMSGSAEERAAVRVLVAEDNAVNRLLVKRMFEKLGCHIDLAGNGREAVEMAARLRYDIIFMDCFMPELDGYGASRELRELEQGDHRVPIIALTANAMADDRAKCLAAGMDDYLSKPVGLEDIRKALQRWVFDVRAPESDGRSSAVQAGALSR
jgi:CheY-like chemotaxis protein